MTSPFFRRKYAYKTHHTHFLLFSIGLVSDYKPGPQMNAP